MDDNQKAIFERHTVAREVQNILELLQQFTNISRYSRDHMVQRENDMEHTGFVVMFCYIVALRMKDKGYTLDLGVLLSKAVIHDIEEAMTGDIIRTTKHANKTIRHEIKGVEATAVVFIQKFLNVDFHETWQTAKAVDMEGELVQLADIAAVVYKCMSEISMYGNRSFNRVLEEVSVVTSKMNAQAKKDQLDEGREAPFDWLIFQLHDLCIRIKQGHMDHNSFWRTVGENPYG